MAEYRQKDNSGSLFKNDRKEQENHPDYKGGGMIDGTEYWIAAWIKASQAGQKYMSLSFIPKDKQTAPKQANKGSYSSAPPAEPVTFDMDVPF